MSVLDGPLVFVDIETNGLNHVRGKVIEVAAIRVEQGSIVRKFTSLVDPETELPQFITRLTGITSQDLRGAPTFLQIADELHELLQGAVFVAHNVRFDYSFLKQEFKRSGHKFLPKQLCTVKLSKALYPAERSHKLESLIRRHGFTFEARHRAYDDAAVLWQFIQKVQQTFGSETVEAAIAKQIRKPSLPKALNPNLVQSLPETPGVYIFQDEASRPLYVGKSINIKKRVLSHFGHDHDDSKEFKISQAIHHIETHETGGELEGLLLESQLVKELQPIYNRQLRRMSKLILARSKTDENGYVRVVLEEASSINPDGTDTVLSVYATRGKARSSLEDILRLYDLCPKLMGFEKGAGSCFLYQLKKCRGACIGEEPTAAYNERLAIAFERRKIQHWPYKSPVLMAEKVPGLEQVSALVVDQWCVIGRLKQEPYCEAEFIQSDKVFDLDTYKILQAFMSKKLPRLSIQPIAWQQLESIIAS